MAEEAADSLSAVYEPVPAAADAASDSVHAPLAVADSLAGRFAAYDVWEERTVVFNPDPTKAVWMSGLCRFCRMRIAPECGTRPKAGRAGR